MVGYIEDLELINVADILTNVSLNSGSVVSFEIYKKKILNQFYRRSLPYFVLFKISKLFSAVFDDTGNTFESKFTIECRFE